MKNLSEEGFTLIELLATVAVVSLIVATAIPEIKHYKALTYEAVAKKQALDLYQAISAREIDYDTCQAATNSDGFSFTRNCGPSDRAGQAPEGILATAIGPHGFVHQQGVALHYGYRSKDFHGSVLNTIIVFAYHCKSGDILNHRMVSIINGKTLIVSTDAVSIQPLHNRCS